MKEEEKKKKKRRKEEDRTRPTCIRKENKKMECIGRIAFTGNAGDSGKIRSRVIKSEAR